MDVQQAIEEINASINSVTDPVARAIISQLLNIIEYQAQEIKTLKVENQRLRDENNRLKGEQGKPNIRSKSKKNVSSEAERKQHGQNKNLKRSKSKNHKIKINHTVKCKINPKQLPEDAVFKGYRTVIIQDISVKTNNVKFKKEVYYSPSKNKTFTASVPDGYNGEFGPHIKSLIITQHFKYKMTEPAIVEFLRDHGIEMSAATVSRIITDHNDQFHAEKKDIVEAGLPSSVYQQMDDTGAKVNGKNYYTHVLCNQYYTAYFTRSNKSRLTVLEILAQKELSFQFNESAYDLMSEMGLSSEVLAKDTIHYRNPKDGKFDSSPFDRAMDSFKDGGLNPTKIDGSLKFSYTKDYQVLDFLRSRAKGDNFDIETGGRLFFGGSRSVGSSVFGSGNMQNVGWFIRGSAGFNGASGTAETAFGSSRVDVNSPSGSVNLGAKINSDGTRTNISIGVIVDAKLIDIKGQFKSGKMCFEKYCYKAGIYPAMGIGYGLQGSFGYDADKQRGIDSFNVLAGASLGPVPVMFSSKIILERAPNKLDIDADTQNNNANTPSSSKPSL